MYKVEFYVNLTCLIFNDLAFYGMKTLTLSTVFSSQYSEKTQWYQQSKLVVFFYHWKINVEIHSTFVECCCRICQLFLIISDSINSLDVMLLSDFQRTFSHRKRYFAVPYKRGKVVKTQGWKWEHNVWTK